MTRDELEKTIIELGLAVEDLNSVLAYVLYAVRDNLNDRDKAVVLERWLSMRSHLNQRRTWMRTHIDIKDFLYPRQRGSQHATTKD